MLVKDLSGAELDYWVAKAEGLEPQIQKGAFADICWCPLYPHGSMNVGLSAYQPSIDWSQGGPIIEREKIGTVAVYNDDGSFRYWFAVSKEDGKGPTPLIAAMRAYVASKFGDEVEM